MPNAEADAIIKRLLDEEADDERERIEAGRQVVERFARLPDNVAARVLRGQQARQQG